MEKSNALREKGSRLYKQFIANTQGRFRRKKKAPAAAAGAPPVVLIHGLSVSHRIMLFIKWRLEKKYGRKVINVVFSTRSHDLPECAEILSQTLKKHGVRQFDAITHSAGGVILRWAMNHCAMPHLRRAVLVSAPNTGAWLADYWSGKAPWLLRFVMGESGLQVRRGERGLPAHAGLLEGIEFGVIAGGSGKPGGVRSPFPIPGDNDRMVAVEETILPGMKDFVLLHHDHLTILFSAQAVHLANLFLEHGVFRPHPSGSPAH
jgi:pimeloyl-ACP methyl ester carboxylesterase